MNRNLTISQELVLKINHLYIFSSSRPIKPDRSIALPTIIARFLANRSTLPGDISTIEMLESTAFSRVGDLLVNAYTFLFLLITLD